jgi:hypothetical protein
VVWINCGGVLLNYTDVQEECKVADVSLQTLFVALHVLAQPLIANEDFQVRKPTHGRRKLKVKAATIRKVILRRVIHPNHEGTVGSIEYHCRWVVQSHWRMQQYTSTGHIRPLLMEHNQPTFNRCRGGRCASIGSVRPLFSNPLRGTVPVLAFSG